MHKFHTLQCMNNKLLLSNHHFLWPNIHTLRGSSSSVCDGEHFVLKIHKLLLFDFIFVFKKYASCNHPLKNIQTWATQQAFSMSFVNATQPWANKNCVMYVKKNWCPKSHTINHVHQAFQNTFEGDLKFQSLKILSQHFLLSCKT